MIEDEEKYAAQYSSNHNALAVGTAPLNTNASNTNLGLQIEKNVKAK